MSGASLLAGCTHVSALLWDLEEAAGTLYGTCGRVSQSAQRLLDRRRRKDGRCSHRNRAKCNLRQGMRYAARWRGLKKEKEVDKTCRPSKSGCRAKLLKTCYICGCCTLLLFSNCSDSHFLAEARIQRNRYVVVG